MMAYSDNPDSFERPKRGFRDLLGGSLSGFGKGMVAASGSSLGRAYSAASGSMEEDEADEQKKRARQKSKRDKDDLLSAEKTYSQGLNSFEYNGGE